MEDILLSIIIPCYNEKNFIETVIERIIIAVGFPKEIIIIDDGSNDGTTEILRERVEQKVDKVLYHKDNLGKGASLRDGFKVARGKIIIIQDADLEYDPINYSKLVKPIIENKADVVYGSRFVSQDEHRVLFFWHMLGNKFLTLMSNMLTNLNLTDIETCYKAFRKELLEKIILKENGFGFEPEITAKFAKLKCRIYEVGISYYGRDYSEGKKIVWIDGLTTLWCIIRYNCLS